MRDEACGLVGLGRVMAAGCLLALVVGWAGAVRAAPEDIMVGAFDKLTGVPVMSAMLGIVRSGEQVPTTPAVLDQRLRSVERMLQAIDSRLRLVERRLADVEKEVVRLANIGRLRELQRVRSEVLAITRELMAQPTDPTRLAVLTFRAQQQADILRDAVDFDIWKWTDLYPAAAAPEQQRLRHRFRVLPTFELYGLAIQTWITAILAEAGTRPQVIVREQGEALLGHAAFLRTRDGWQARVSNTVPATLPENLGTAVYCTLDHSPTYADRNGLCPYAVMCIDEIEDTVEQTGEITLVVQPRGASTLCTWNSDNPPFMPGQEELRSLHGLEVMTAMAQSLERLAHTGSLAEQQVWPFPTTSRGAIFAVSLDRPLAAPLDASAGTEPRTKRCPAFSGCRISETTHDVHWTYDRDSGEIGHQGSELCLDVRDNSARAGAGVVLWPCDGAATQAWDRRASTNQHYSLAVRGTGLCATLTQVQPPAGDARLLPVDAPRSLHLEPCDGRPTQTFSNTDSGYVGPH